MKCGAPLLRNDEPAAPSTHADEVVGGFKAGDIIDERYKVIGTLGVGGMGVVYRVHDMVLHEDVALKLMASRLSRDRMAIERFYNEARVTRQLTHRNIVRVHDIGEYHGLLYLSMELLEGRSLRRVAQQRADAGEPMSFAEVVDIVCRVCDALEYAHKFTIHRDIKPENVMMTDAGEIKLMDFGLSKLLAAPSMTKTSAVMGTPMYMAPEQLRDSAHVDLRTDLFSVGIMLYELLTGHVPRGMARPASDLRGGVPPAVDVIISKCTNPDPVQRYGSAGEIRDALRSSYLDMYGEMPVGTARRSRGGRKVLKVALGLGLAAAVTAAVCGAIVMRRRPLRDARSALADLNATVHQASKLTKRDPEKEKQAAQVSARARELMEQKQYRKAAAEFRRAEELYLALGPGRVEPPDRKSEEIRTQPTDTEPPAEGTPQPGSPVEPEPEDTGPKQALPQAVRTVWRRAIEVRSQANEAGAAELVPELFNQGEVHWENGNSFQETGAFGDARQEYVKATDKYKLAAAEARAAKAVPDGMVYVFRGTFIMGSGSGNRDEQPEHAIDLPGFYIDKYEVSVADYRRFVEATNRPMPVSWNTGAMRPEHPAIGVTWVDAMAYAKWAGKRLPTEAEWEKAARGTDGFTYPWGSAWEEGKCNAAGVKSDRYRTLAPVTAFPQSPSPFGCYNMAGNAVEWVSSLYMPYPYAAGDGRENLNLRRRRVLRGGSYHMQAAEMALRTTARFAADPLDTSLLPGFRCAADVRSPGPSTGEMAAGTGPRRAPRRP